MEMITSQNGEADTEDLLRGSGFLCRLCGFAGEWVIIITEVDERAPLIYSCTIVPLLNDGGFDR